MLVPDSWDDAMQIDVRQLARVSLQGEHRRRLQFLGGATATIAVIAALYLLLAGGPLPKQLKGLRPEPTSEAAQFDDEIATNGVQSARMDVPLRKTGTDSPSLNSAGICGGAVDCTQYQFLAAVASWVDSACPCSCEWAGSRR